MSESTLTPQRCSGSNHHFDLSELPAVRIETNRGFGIAVSCFALPFVAAILFGVIWAFQSEEWIFFGIFLFAIIIPNLILAWGLINLLTKIQVTISPQTVELIYQRPWGNSRWEEPLKRFLLQIAVTRTRNSETKALDETFHIRLKHSNDLQSIELHSTESRDELREQYHQYTKQLNVKQDKHIRDYNTEEPIGNPKTFAMDSDENVG